jgi:hypothetical protein
MVNYGNPIVGGPPLIDASLCFIVDRIEVPEIKTRLIECMYVIIDEWTLESHSAQYDEAFKVLTQFRRNHLI